MDRARSLARFFIGANANRVEVLDYLARFRHDAVISGELSMGA